MNSMSGSTAGGSVLVWDLPTRVFHWLFAASFAVAWLTHDSSRLLDVHVFAGYLFAALLVFRLVWGVAGGRYARFRSFVWSWRDARAYLVDALRGRARRFLGHNPAGSWAIYAMLALGLAVAATGIGVLGGEERHGPLAGLLGFRTGAVLHEAHEFAAIAMLLLVLGHLAGVVVESAVHRENLIAAMVSGRKRGRAPLSRRRDRPAGRHAARCRGLVLGISVRESRASLSAVHRPPARRKRHVARRVRELPPRLPPGAAAGTLVGGPHDRTGRSLRR